MNFSLKTIAEVDALLAKMENQVKKNSFFATKYLKLGVKIIRIQCYTPKILPFLEQQLSYVLCNTADCFDETIVVWHETDIKNMLCSLDDLYNPKKNMRLRLGMICNGKKYPSLQVSYESFPVLAVSDSANTIEAYDRAHHICYYCVEDFEPEEFIKQGHLFVQILNTLLKDNKTNLSHGAVIGFNNNGALLCARGQRGKSTLCIHSLLNGFDYVSDDYQIIQQKEKHLCAFPIYSIITLSPLMYQKMYDSFNGKFCCNNARKDKYVFNIASYHPQFKTNYPIRLGLFPEIVADDRPSIQKCSAEEKGRAIVQFIHSTVLQMRDINNTPIIKKLFYMVNSLPFYKINLCPHLAENTQCLKLFLDNFSEEKTINVPLEKILCDITFDVATFLDTKTFILYTFNKFATNLYQLLCADIDPKEIISQLTPLQIKNPSLIQEFERFISILKEKGFLQHSFEKKDKPFLNLNFVAECFYKISVIEYTQKTTIDLIKLKEKI